ncbi:ABC transporter ATP-binding protein/permease [Enhydrobacter sp.]|jgi:putative ATP-binding cassette transporter|uniref:ABC transporter ATP-binding protein/permease n=1 Tax=Enhydrobacter sp. TaxID=1894999 RepID=UPI00260AA5CF|nr:ABC transporter ATP-binding protein/permease [Enhydrobacter sp.]WIM13398.1 MAG: Efflux ABC transporter, permease/ATP-binding protein [Enhydrobacter sp.]
MKRVGSFLGDWWRLVIPYFKSEEWPIAITLLVGAIALTFAGVGLEVLFNDWNRRFYDSIQNKNEAVFWKEIIFFSWLAALYIMVFVARAIVSPYLRLRWRKWLTRHYLAHWLDDRGYYRIELMRSVDNVDQRISEDLNQLGQYTMTLLLGLLSAVATLVSFLFILWELSGPLSLAPIGIDFTIPGYMAWVCLIYAVVGSYLANLVGRRLIPLNFMRQRYEANFRFSLVRVRENAEGIALYHGEQREDDALNARFIDVFNNGFRVLMTQAQLAFYQSGYAQLAIVFPYVVTAPRFFAGAITFGVMTQTASAFGQVQSALSFFIDNYTSLAELRAVMDRLKGFQIAADEKPATAIDVTPQAGRSDVAAEKLTLALPTGQALLEDLDLPLRKGQSVLVRGASGTGKSTLFRALAGIWPFGSGQVRVPEGARVLFLPQKPYIPIGTLRDAIKYPDEHSRASDTDIAEALRATGLGHLVDRLDEVAHWNNVLSGGEQQRLAAARAIVFKPDWLFMDEATASLDEAAEAMVYSELKRRLPDTTMVSIGHRPTLRKWHDRLLELKREPGQVGTLVEVPA